MRISAVLLSLAMNNISVVQGPKDVSYFIINGCQVEATKKEIKNNPDALVDKILKQCVTDEN